MVYQWYNPNPKSHLSCSPLGPIFRQALCCWPVPWATWKVKHKSQIWQLDRPMAASSPNRSLFIPCFIEWWNDVKCQFLMNQEFIGFLGSSWFSLYQIAIISGILDNFLHMVIDILPYSSIISSPKFFLGSMIPHFVPLQFPSDHLWINTVPIWLVFWKNHPNWLILSEG